MCADGVGSIEAAGSRARVIATRMDDDQAARLLALFRVTIVIEVSRRRRTVTFVI